MAKPKEKLKDFIIQKENQRICICALVQFLISCGTDYIAFEIFSWFYSTMKFIFAVLLFFVWKGIFSLFRKIQQRDDGTLMRVKLFCVYFGALMVLLMLIWPGNWTNDDVIIYDYSVRFVQFDYWQHFFTSVFYILSLMVFPFPSGIIIMQVILISLITADCIAWVYEITDRRKSAFLLLIPFFSLPVLFSDFHPLRLTLCAFIDLYLIKTLAALYFSKKLLTSGQLVLPVLLTVILAVWRTENMYYVLLMPVLFILCFYKTTTRKQKAAFCASVVCASLALFCIQSNGVKTEGNYNDTGLTSFMELYFRAEKEGDTDFTEAVEKVYRGKLLHWGADHNLSCGKLLIRYSLKKDDVSPEDVRNFYIEYAKAVVKYNDTFIAERNSLFFNNYWIPTELHDINKPNEIYGEIDECFRESGLLTASPFPTLRYDILSWLYMHPDKDMLCHSLPFRIIWSQIPPLILLILSAIVLVLKKKYVYSGLICISLIKNVLIYLTAPDRFFMYYFPAYLIGYAVAAALIYIGFVRKAKRKDEHEGKPRFE